METAITRDMLFLLLARSFGQTKRLGTVFRKDGDSLRLKPPIDWGQDPFNDRNWCFNLHALRAIDPALDKHIRTGKPEALRYALSWILDWRRAQLEGTASEFANHDMASGLRAGRIAYVLQHAEAGNFPVEASELNILRALASEHMEALGNPDFLARNNHALFSDRRSLCSGAGLWRRSWGRCVRSGARLSRRSDNQMVYAAWDSYGAFARVPCVCNA